VAGTAGVVRWEKTRTYRAGLLRLLVAKLSISGEYHANLIIRHLHGIFMLASTECNLGTTPKESKVEEYSSLHYYAFPQT